MNVFKPVAWTSKYGMLNLTQHRAEGRSHYSLQLRVDRFDDYSTEPLYAREVVDAARSVTRRMLDDWIPDLDERGWWHVGSGMQGPGEPMTEDEFSWLTFMDKRG